MNVSLTPQFEEMIEKKVQSGLYQSASEVVREALRLLDDRDKLRQIRLEDLRKEIAIGIKDLEEGRWVVAKEDLAKQIAAEGRRRLAEERGIPR